VRAVVLLLGILVGAAAPGPAALHAETLQEALALAYETNPTIRAERARLRALRETRAQAWAAALPQIQGAGSYSKVEGSQTTVSGILGGAEQSRDVRLETITAGVNGELPVFTGFRNFNAIKQAGARIRAGGAQLVATEQQILNDVAAAYFNVQRNMAVYRLNVKNIDVLLRQSEMATVRFEVGEITRTDVAQADARLANARAELTNAQGNLAISRARYAQLVGRVPGDLAPIGSLPELPDNVEAAQTLAIQFAPPLVAAREQSEVSRRQISITKGALLPSVSLTAGYQYADDPSTFVTQDEQFAYGARATMPLFLGGLNFSRIREARALHDSDRSRVREAERQVAANVTTAWERLIASRAIIISSRSAVDANELALEGVTQEALAGTRTTLDVLDAERELLNAQVSFVSAERDAQAAAFALLTTIGLLTPEAIGIDQRAGYGEDLYGEPDGAP